MITITGLNAGYGKLLVLHNVTVAFTPNQFTAILGPNGSGKSTLLKSVFGLTTVFDGSIQYQDQQLVGKATEDISRLGIAYVPQRSNVFTVMTVRENLKLAVRHLSHQEAQQGLEAVYDLFPILSKRVRQRAGQLSGGERQMVAIAMGWLTQPQLMLLDEPSAGLSPLLVKETFSILQRLKTRGITMIVVEQNARSILQYCDDVVMLREGQVVFEGTVEECRADEDLVKNYLGVKGKS